MATKKPAKKKPATKSRARGVAPRPVAKAKAKRKTAAKPVTKPAKKAASKPAEKRPAGRPTAYTAELADRICMELQNNDVSLRQICSRAGMPHRSTVTRWLGEHEEFATKYAHAREGQGDVVFERMTELEQLVLLGKVEAKAARVVLESRRWRADKLNPKKYGTKVGIGQADGLLPLVMLRDMTGRKDAPAA